MNAKKAGHDQVGHRPFLARLGSGIARHHRIVALCWLLVLVGGGYLASAYEKSVSDNFRIPHTDSQAAYDLLDKRFSSQNGATATIVFAAPEGRSLDNSTASEQIDAIVKAAESLPGVASVSNPTSNATSEAIEQLAAKLPAADAAGLEELAATIPKPFSESGQIGYATVTYKDPLPDLMETYPVNPDKAATDYANPYSALQKAVDGVDTGTMQVEVGGVVADTWNNPVSWWASHADEVGLLIGALLLLVAFGSLWAMCIPISTALFGAVTASGLVYLLADLTTVSSAAPPVTMMISIGVGLDYSLLIVTRYRQFVAEGRDPVEAVGDALSTAGKAAVFAGLTVCVALLGLLVVPIPLVQTLGLAAAIGVAVMMLAATTLLPALLGFAGKRIDAIGLPSRHKAAGDPHTTFWGRFATAVSGKPWRSLIGGTVVLLLLAAPFLGIRFGMPDDGALPAQLSQRQAFDLMQDGFGSGANAPLVVAVGLPEGVPFEQALQDLEPVSKAVGAEQKAGTIEGVDAAIGPIPNSLTETTAVIYQVTPAEGPDPPATGELVRRLRTDLGTATDGTGMEAHVGGATATLLDLTKQVTKYLPIVIGAVVIGAFILLTLVFRSILVPLKAAIMNLLSIGAAYGVVVAVFQWGWAKQAVGISETIPIVSFVPLVMFVILFGLSMDYEVFLMSRMREEWDRTGDPRESVVLGVSNTARVITTAALIMIAVFLSFVTNPNPTVKLIGFGMAVAVLIDSTLVRMLLVPAAMELLGKRAWWFPKWLGWLPHLNIEGPPELAAPAPGAASDDAAPEPVPVG